jgi:hypothetical protein
MEKHLICFVLDSDEDPSYILDAVIEMAQRLADDIGGAFGEETASVTPTIGEVSDG